MPMYRVLEPSFIDNVLCKEGDEVRYDGVPGPNLEPINDKAKDAVSAAAAAREFALRHPEAHVGGPSVTGDALTPEQNAGLQAASALDPTLTPAAVSQAPTPDTTPTKGQVKAADKLVAADDKAKAEAAGTAQADAAADAAAGAVKGVLAK